jgi:predicted amidohydrolase
MKIAAYQASLLAAGSIQAIDLIAGCVRECEAAGVSVLCCPEGVLGGLADYSDSPSSFAIRPDELVSILRPLTSPAVTSIVGYTELAPDGALYNAAAVFQLGAVIGVYRKIHPAIRRSVYSAGSEIPVFQAGALTFGVVICYDSNFPELAKQIAAQGATALFIPTNNGLPVPRASPKINSEAAQVDKRLAVDNGLWVVRADTCGDNGKLVSFGSSEIVDPDGQVVMQASQGGSKLLVAEIGEPPSRILATDA